MYKHVLFAFLAATTAPTEVLAEEDIVRIVLHSSSANFNAYQIQCDSPLKPERRHLVTVYNLSTNMDGSSMLEDYLERSSDPGTWFEYEPWESGFQGAFVVSGDGERFFIKDSNAAAALLERFRSGELDPRGIPVEEAQNFVTSVAAQCGFGT